LVPPETDGNEPATQHSITALLGACADGEADAFDRLMPLVYNDLRRMAHNQLRRERAEHTLATTDVVHEAYLLLVDQENSSWRDRAHFFAVASRVMRHILVDYARERGAQKRGGGAIRVPLSEELDGQESKTVGLLELHDALAALGQNDAHLERIVEYRFFGGMSMEDTAEALKTPLRTVERDWARARAYLFQQLS
jgi:RNA polymerase sigma factor (TIGR02999 family)